MVVACGSQNFYDAVADFQNGYIERTAAQIVYHDLLFAFLINAVCQCSSGRLVDDTLYVQTSDLASILGCLTLCVGEVSRYGDNCVGYRRTDICFCISLQLLQDHCGNFLWGVLLAVDGYAVVRTHVTLDGNDGALCVGNSLVLCCLANNALALLVECDNRRCGSCTLAVRDDNGFAALHNCNTGIGSTQINTDNLAHDMFLLYQR